MKVTAHPTSRDVHAAASGVEKTRSLRILAQRAVLSWSVKSPSEKAREGTFWRREGEASNKVERCCDDNDDNEKDEKEGSIEREEGQKRRSVRKRKRDRLRGKEAEETERFEGGRSNVGE